MKFRNLLMPALIALALLPVRAALAVQQSAAEDDTRITAEEVMAQIKRGESVLVLDVRAPGPYKSSSTRIKGDIRIENEEDLYAKMKDVPHDRPIVAYCT